MGVELNAQQKEAQDSFRAFVDEAILPHSAGYEQEECLPPELVGKLACQGYLGALLPEAQGGEAMDAVTYGLLNEELGRGSSSVRGLVMLQNMVATTISKWGSNAQKEFWPQRIASGDVIAACAFTEPEAGSDIKAVETTATLVGDAYLLNGHKKWISFGQIADLFLVLGQHEGKLSAFLLERNTPGLSIRPIRDMSGVRATTLAELTFDDCRIPKENLVGAVGFGLAPVAFAALDLGRYSIAWGCVGIAQGCLEACLEHTSSRKQFGAYLMDHQLIQRMIADMIVNVRAARLLCIQAGRLRQSGVPDAFEDTFVAKYFASTTATRAANDAVQIHGASGFQNSHPVQMYLRDAQSMEIIEGTTQIHQIQIAKQAYQAYAKAS